MIIAIDCRLIWTGIGRYLNSVLPVLLEIDRNNKYIFIINENPPNTINSKNVEYIRIKSKPFSFFEHIEIPFVLRNKKLKCYYSPLYNIPLFLTSKIVLITSIYDLVFSRFPKQAKTLFHKIYYELFIRLSLKKSNFIIVQSEYTRLELEKLYNYSKAIRIYPGFKPMLQNTRDPKSSLKKRFGINYDYILYVGVNKYHKNLKTLVRAFNLLSHKSKYNKLQLVIAGPKNSFYYDIEKDILNLRISNKVILTDYIDDNMLALLYSSALIYISPSYLEGGFCYPVLEAQSFKIPVIASEIDLKELGNDSILYFNPYSINDCIEKIERLINSESLRKQLVVKGNENIKRFSVKTCAQELLNIFNQKL